MNEIMIQSKDIGSGVTYIAEPSPTPNPHPTNEHGDNFIIRKPKLGEE